MSELREGHELLARINEMLRLIEEEGETIEITDKGKVVAHVVPANNPQKPVDEKLAASFRRIDELAARIGAQWKSNLDAVEAVREGRPDLSIMPEKAIENSDAAAWEGLKRLAVELDPYWPEDTDAVESVQSIRRDLSCNE